MRNYFDLLGIHRDTDATEKMTRVEAAEMELELEPDFSADLTSVLSSKTRAMHYRRLHLQYEAMATTLSRRIPQQDTNSWEQRLVEFQPTANELPD